MKKKIIIIMLVSLTILLAGCNEEADRDEDGVPDDRDAFPDDPAASRDKDNDGYPDYWNEGYNETNTNLTLDAFPDNANENTDSDGDGYGDNEDELPLNPEYHKLGYLIEKRTEVLEPGEDLSFYMDVNKDHKLLTVYWSLGISDYDASESFYIRYRTPSTWSRKYNGISNTIDIESEHHGQWVLKIGNDGHITGYDKDIPVTFYVYVKS